MSRRSAEALDPADLYRQVAASFDGPGGTPRIGVEVEALVLDRTTGRPVPPFADGGGRAIGPVLADWAAGRGWVPKSIATGAPAFSGPCGATVSFEPGGQLEYASPALTSLDRLEGDLVDVLSSVEAHLRLEGIALVARGVDPRNRLAEAELWVSGERYRRMSAHYARRGPWGRRMMRQTAAVHVNIDAVGPRYDAWRIVNASVPALLAAFANSPVVEGVSSGHRSARAGQWRRLDPSRTGLVGVVEPDPARAYLEFALGADAFLLGTEGSPARPFREHLHDATIADWQRHLTTVFPEVRPRGYLEIRAVDALPLDLCLLPAAVLIGVVFEASSRDAALERIVGRAKGGGRADLLERAGRLGLSDAEVAAEVETLFDLAIQGLSALGPDVAGAHWADRLVEYRRRFTSRGLDPGHGDDEQLVPEPLRPDPTSA